MPEYTITATPTECWSGDTPVVLTPNEDDKTYFFTDKTQWTITAPNGDSLNPATYLSGPPETVGNEQPQSTVEWDGTWKLSVADFVRSGKYTIELLDEARETALASVGIQVRVDRVMLGEADRLATAAEDLVDNGIRTRVEKRSATTDQALWVAIRACTEERSFAKYEAFLSDVLCDGGSSGCTGDGIPSRTADTAWLYRRGARGFALLDTATEVFLLCHACCTDLEGVLDKAEFDEKAEEDRLEYEFSLENIKQDLSSYMSAKRLPYMDTIVSNLSLRSDDGKVYPFCINTMRDRPCMFELIWSYWLEMGYLVQTMAAISRRFQNRGAGRNGADPLANLTIDPLRPLNNLLWGYVQEANDWLTVRRRAHEYSAEYGLELEGKAVGELIAADPRSRFLEALHNLLRECAQFYKDDSNSQIDPDPFPLLNAIVAVHLLLAEGAHNQFGDLPFTARKEMMVQQWLLAQPPMREFLQSRPMMPYDEQWMGQVDAMKRAMGWHDTSVIHFHRLAVFGERLLLGIRYGNWNNVNTSPTQAANWAIYWRTEIQGYMHAYKVVTGVDLAGTSISRDPVDATLPSVLMARRMGEGASQNGSATRATASRGPSMRSGVTSNGRVQR